MRHVDQRIIEAARRGVIFPGAMDMLPRERLTDGAGKFIGWGEILIDQLPANVRAFDAQPTLTTGPNAGVPALFTTYIDPKMIEVLFTPNNAVKIYGEVRKGDWITETVGFPMVEATGEVTSYGDFNDGGGRAGANVQWEWRQPYLFQWWTEWGDREAERMAAGKVDWVARLNISSAQIANKFQNISYFYGVQGLQQYGSLNDPSLSAALTPSIKAAGGTSWALAEPTEIFADVQAGFVELQAQTGSNLEMDSPLVLALNSISEAYLATPNIYGNTAIGLLKKAFPNLRVQQAPQFLSGTTYSYQLFAPNIEGQLTVECAFNERMRAHRMVMASSSMRQKKTSGTMGTVWYFPAGVASMAGI